MEMLLNWSLMIIKIMMGKENDIGNNDDINKFFEI